VTVDLSNRHNRRAWEAWLAETGSEILECIQEHGERSKWRGNLPPRATYAIRGTLAALDELEAQCFTRLVTYDMSGGGAPAHIERRKDNPHGRKGKKYGETFGRLQEAYRGEMPPELKVECLANARAKEHSPAVDGSSVRLERPTYLGDRRKQWKGAVCEAERIERETGEGDVRPETETFLESRARETRAREGGGMLWADWV
jgi:hypothetical protein